MYVYRCPVHEIALSEHKNSLPDVNKVAVAANALNLYGTAVLVLNVIDFL